MMETKGKYLQTVLNYANGVIDGTIIAGEDRILGCKRFMEMLNDERYDIRTRDADFVIGLIESSFYHRQGERLDGTPLRNTPFLMEPWQKFVIYGMLVFWYAGTEERVVKEAFLYIPRKNGKTILVSALAWALSILQRQSGSVVYVVGAALKQAMETFENWDYNLEHVQYPDKRAAIADGWEIHDNNMEHSIKHADLAGGSVSLNALASNPDGQDSFNANIIIADRFCPSCW